MKLPQIIPPLSFLVVLSGTPLTATVLIEEDFEGLTNVTDGAFNRADDESQVEVSLSTAGDPFSLGAGNQYVIHRDADNDDGAVAGLMNSVGALDGGLFSINFLFYEPGADGLNDSILVRVGPDTNSNNAAVDISLNNGTLNATNATAVSNAYALNSFYAMDIVGNESGASVNYEGKSLANNRYDVWLTDSSGSSSLVLSDVLFRSTGETLDSFFFQTFSSAQQEIYYDNLTITDNEAVVIGVIPEPATSALLLGGTLAFGAMFRRRR